jgi:hypothetical protein
VVERERLGFSVDEFSTVTGKSKAAIRADVARASTGAAGGGRKLFILYDDAMAFVANLPAREIHSKRV